MSWEKRRVLVTVTAYPERSEKYGASVCTAGITEEGEFIRLYPMPFELFRRAERFHKYDWIEVECMNSSGNEKLKRKESYRVRPDTIKVLDNSLSRVPIDWNARNRIILNLLDDSIEQLQDAYSSDGTSLGIIRPLDVQDLHKTVDVTRDELEAANYVQLDIDGRRKTPLQEMPHVFKYRFACNDERCKGHDMVCLDWELCESYRSWKYASEEELWGKIRERFFSWMGKRDLHFYVGMHSLYPSWMIIGLYYPPKKA